MKDDDDYHVSGEFHAMIASKAVKNTSPLFQDRMRLLAQALALCCAEYDGSMLTELYEHIYLPIIRDDSQLWEDRENLFPRPRDVAYTRQGQLKVEMTLNAQRNYFTSASRAYLFPLGVPMKKVAPHRKRSHDKVYLYRSALYSPTAKNRVSKRLQSAITDMLNRGAA